MGIGREINTGSHIRSNLEGISDRIQAACRRAGRPSQEVRLVAISKTVDAETALQGMEAGITDLGENRAQDLIDKYALIGDKVNWHFVGHLQRNKVKQIVNIVKLIHSLDGYPLADEINRRAKEINKTQEALVEVNVSEEKSKFGLHPEEVFAFIEQVKVFDNLKIRGLMTMAPLGAAESRLRDVFSLLRSLSESLAALGIGDPILSMGMTDDFEIAVEEGANMIRIGRAVFES